MIETLNNYYKFDTECKFKQNEELKGVEVYFTSIPTVKERNQLKESNWHWNHKKACWYIKEKLLRDMNILTDKIEKTVKKGEKKKQEELPKSVLSKVKTILNIDKQRVALNGYTPLKHYTSTKSFEYRVAFTDSYRLCILNKEYLPFKVCFTQDKDLKKDYLKKYGDKIEEEIKATYPNLEACIPQNDPEDIFIINIKEVKERTKGNTAKSKKDNRIMTFTTKKENKKICIDSLFLNDMITLLQIKDEEIEMNFYGELKPATYENENGYYLALPIRSF